MTATSYPIDRGCCIWLTGLSGAGKTATAEVLTVSGTYDSRTTSWYESMAIMPTRKL